MNAIAAMDLNRVIGRKGKIPWRIPADMRWFKTMTSSPTEGGYLVMGMNTYQNVGALPGRRTYVLTNSPLYRNPETNSSLTCFVNLSELLKLNLPWSSVWVVGGAKTYAALMPHVRQVYMTYVLDEYEGDVYMPPFEEDFKYSEIVKEAKDYWIVRYWRDLIFL